MVVSVIRPHSLNPFFGSGAFRHQRGVLNIYLPFCYYHDLDQLKRGGRISSVSATFGKALQIKPLISVDDEGHL
ncbi:DegV family protein, partial [Alistipes putredinis]|uniref:DegV family protein n=1 Tax=Alistipes putredinis TaxID=28117 RepID=UPI003AB1FEE2